MKSRYTFLIFAVVTGMLLILWSAITHRHVSANLGWPPVNPSGASPGIGVNTNVRMVSEKVDLTIEPYFRPVPGGEMDSPAYFMRGLVDASFQMRNLGQELERLDVWFPLSASVRYPDVVPYLTDNTVQDFRVWVGGVPVKTEIVKAPDLSNPQLESNWAKFPIAFPAGHNVIVRVTYTIYPSGRRPFGGFEYILQTGAGWKDTIGEAVVTVHLPYSVNPDFVSLSGRSIEGLPLAPNPPGYRIDSNTIRWKFTDFEPTAEYNIFVEVLEPDRYRKLLQTRARVQSEPVSISARLEHANAAQNAVMVIYSVGQHGGGERLAEEANAAYRRALELAPQRADIYGLYANWLWHSIGLGSIRGKGTCPKELCDLVRRGLEAFPSDPELIKVNEWIRAGLDEFGPFHTQQARNRNATLTKAALVSNATQTQTELDRDASLIQIELDRKATLTQTVLDRTPTARTPLKARAPLTTPVAVYATITSVHATRQSLIAARLPTQTLQPSQTPDVMLTPADLTVSTESFRGLDIATILLLGLIVMVLAFVWLRQRVKKA